MQAKDMKFSILRTSVNVRSEARDTDKMSIIIIFPQMTVEHFQHFVHYLKLHETIKKESLELDEHQQILYNNNICFWGFPHLQLPAVS